MPNDVHVYRPIVELSASDVSALPACSLCGRGSPHGPICTDCTRVSRADRLYRHGNHLLVILLAGVGLAIGIIIAFLLANIGR